MPDRTGRQDVTGAVATQRLFFALWPDPALQAQLYEQTGALLGKNSGRRVASDNLHLTLAFLGSVDEAVRACVQAMADNIRAAPFTLVMDRVGHWRRPQVLWLGCSSAPSAVRQLVDRLNAGILACGLAPDTRPCQPHLTLARKVRRDPGAGVVCPPVSWPVERFALVQSQTFAEGAQYRVLHSWPLTG